MFSLHFKNMTELELKLKGCTLPQLKVKKNKYEQIHVCLTISPFDDLSK